MASLKDNVESAARDLQTVWNRVSGRPPSTVLPNACYERWETQAFHHLALLGTIPLFDVRNKAWQIVESLIDSRRIQYEKAREQNALAAGGAKVYNFSHDGVEMDFASARHLSLVSYASVSWSIYDRITNVCGRLMATDEVVQHAKQNPKLVEDFLAWDKKAEPVSIASHSSKSGQVQRYEYGAQLFACSTQHHIRMAYDWPIRFCYTVRNWLVHEGQTVGSVRLFHSDRIEDGFRLHTDAVSEIEKRSNFKRDDNGDPKRCCVRGSACPWRDGQDKDLLIALKVYHAEVDSMLADLLSWSLHTFVTQFSTFSARDKAAFATRAATSLS